MFVKKHKTLTRHKNTKRLEQQEECRKEFRTERKGEIQEKVKVRHIRKKEAIYFSHKDMYTFLCNSSLCLKGVKIFTLAHFMVKLTLPLQDKYLYINTRHPFLCNMTGICSFVTQLVQVLTSFMKILLFVFLDVFFNAWWCKLCFIINVLRAGLVK